MRLTALSSDALFSARSFSVSLKERFFAKSKNSLSCSLANAVAVQFLFAFIPYYFKNAFFVIQERSDLLVIEKHG